MSRPPLPPFTAETARQKVRLAEDAWNSRDPDRVVLVYAQDTRWRNRSEFPVGREEVRAFLQRKWAREPAQGSAARRLAVPAPAALELSRGARAPFPNRNEIRATGSEAAAVSDASG